MPEPTKPAATPQTSTHPAPSTLTPCAAGAGSDRMPCDRCGVDMFRMHAVWRCPACGYKTDCCGW